MFVLPPDVGPTDGEVVRTLNTAARGRINGDILTSNDGGLAAFQRGGRVRVLDAFTAATTRTFEDPTGYEDCRVTRWWNETTLAAGCTSAATGTKDVFALDIETGSTRRLTSADADSEGWTTAWWTASGTVALNGDREDEAPLQWAADGSDIGRDDFTRGITVVDGQAYSRVVPDTTEGQMLEITDLATDTPRIVLGGEGLDVVQAVPIDPRG